MSAAKTLTNETASEVMRCDSTFFPGAREQERCAPSPRLGRSTRTGVQTPTPRPTRHTTSENGRLDQSQAWLARCRRRVDACRRRQQQQQHGRPSLACLCHRRRLSPALCVAQQTAHLALALDAQQQRARSRRLVVFKGSLLGRAVGEHEQHELEQWPGAALDRL